MTHKHREVGMVGPTFIQWLLQAQPLVLIASNPSTHPLASSPHPGWTPDVSAASRATGRGEDRIRILIPLALDACNAIASPAGCGPSGPGSFENGTGPNSSAQFMNPGLTLHAFFELRAFLNNMRSTSVQVICPTAKGKDED